VHHIGDIQAGPRGCTVAAGPETWNGGRAWSATHNA
jgi:hypothetical protein